MTSTPDNAALDPQLTIAELQRQLDEARDELARRNSAYSERIAYQAAANDVLKVMSASPGDPQPVFDLISIRARDICDAYGVTVCEFDGSLLHWRASTGISEDPAVREAVKAAYPTAPTRDLAPGRAILTCAIVHIRDHDMDPELRRFSLTVNSSVVVPMMRGGVPIGTLHMGSRERGGFSEDQVELLKTFADQAVIAIENARLFSEVQAKTRDLEESLQQQTATADVLKVISRSAFDLKAVLDTLVKSAASLCTADTGIIYLRDGELFHAGATFGSDPQFLDALKSTPRKAGRDSVASRVILSGEVEQVPDVREDKEYHFPVASTFAPAQRAVIGVPLLREGAVEGVLALIRNVPGLFVPREVALLQTFADQAVIAIQNAKLFEQVQARTRELTQSLNDLRAAQDRLIQTEKLASLGQLTAGIAHEIKNPLNFVNNFSAISVELVNEMNDVLELAKLDNKNREELDEIRDLLKGNLEKVVQHGKRADSIVKNMLLHSRSGSGEHRPVEINAVIEESLNLAYHGARAEGKDFNITLERDFDPAAGVADIYPQEITRVLLNLISNGFYAATKRAFSASEGFEPKLKAVTRNIGEKVEIRIRDNGTGIPVEIREKIFNPFFTTKPAGEGTGLGLSMSHDIVVKQHGGTIDVVTEPGSFTEFTITLPRNIPAVAEAGGRDEQPYSRGRR
jgi:two-component system NtrC family sensor kinase